MWQSLAKWRQWLYISVDVAGALAANSFHGLWLKSLSRLESPKLHTSRQETNLISPDKEGMMDAHCSGLNCVSQSKYSYPKSRIL